MFAANPEDERFHGSIGSAANWADRQGHTPANAGWHYIDTNDQFHVLVEPELTSYV